MSILRCRHTSAQVAYFNLAIGRGMMYLAVVCVEPIPSSPGLAVTISSRKFSTLLICPKTFSVFLKTETECINDGDVIRVDGTEGYVEIISRDQ